MRYFLALATICCFAVPAVGAETFERQEEVLTGPTSGPWRRLFLDATVVEESQGLRRVFHSVEKFSGNPVVRKDNAWEGTGPYLYGTVMWDGGKLRMWYHHINPDGMWNSYAESSDGISWTKPALGLIDYEGSKRNNLFAARSSGLNEKPPGDIGQCHNPSVIFQPWQRDPNKRYALYSYSYEWRVPHVAFSADGLRWNFLRPTPGSDGLFRSGDVVNFFHDPYKNRFIATWKTATERGRAVGVATSDDGLAWSKPVPGAVMFADNLDPDATQIYGMPVFPYQGYYLGLPWIYNARWPKDRPATGVNLAAAERTSPNTMDVQFAWSRNLVNWNRSPERAGFIPRGAVGEFDSGMIYTARSPVLVGDKLYFYYGGFNAPHNARAGTTRAAIGLGILRLDGFCSLHSEAMEGSFITRPERLETPAVTINAHTTAQGFVEAEIVDSAGQALEGFSRKESVAFRGDSVRHRMKWKTTSFTPEQQKLEKKLKFYLKEADVYSYDTAPSTARQSPRREGPSGKKLGASNAD